MLKLTAKEESCLLSLVIVLEVVVAFASVWVGRL